MVGTRPTRRPAARSASSAFLNASFRSRTVRDTRDASGLVSEPVDAQPRPRCPRATRCTSLLTFRPHERVPFVCLQGTCWAHP